MKKILVTGGAGYIGSFIVRDLIKNYEVYVIDNLSQGHKNSLPSSVKLYEVDLKDKEKLNEIFKQNQIDAVIHMAASSAVGESVQNPQKYYKNNIINSLNLLEAMMKNNVKNIVFSSSAAVYGEPEEMPIQETTKTMPTNPYGRTKLEFEKILKDYEDAYELNHISLRYFNAAGGAKELGEHHEPESHLIPIILQYVLGKRDELKIFGTDYNTPDGTCVRDYIHVIDLAQAHILALQSLSSGKKGIYNLGNGKGFSIKEILKTCREVTNHPIPTQNAPRRPGDPATLIASSEKIRQELGWEPKYNLKEIISSAWEWHKNHPKGFKN